MGKFRNRARDSDKEATANIQLYGRHIDGQNVKLQLTQFTTLENNEEWPRGMIVAAQATIYRGSAPGIRSTSLDVSKPGLI